MVSAEETMSSADDKKPQLAEGDETEVTIEKIVAGGDGLARAGGIPLFVPRSAPGDRLRVRLVQRRPSYGRAEIVEILTAGPLRREPPCPHFADCGGCDLQHIEDGEQSRLKAEAVIETLRRLGGLSWPGEVEIITGEPWGYRLRTQLRTVPLFLSVPDSEQKTLAAGPVPLGYLRRGTHDLVPITGCPVLVPELEAMVRALPDQLDMERTGKKPPQRIDLAAGDAGAVTVAPRLEGLPSGEITLTVGENTYAYDANCFFQTHRGLLQRLIEVVVGPENGGPEEGETAYDLYCGVGLFTLPLARRYAKVVTVEGDRAAARYARINARRNRLKGVEVEARAIESWLPRLPDNAARVVVDPPRTGLSVAIRAALLQRKPRRLTYVSCHAATLARDLKVLAGKFTIESITLLDLFPQTGHMEAVVQLRYGV